jgi:hypothetical protein
MIQKTVSRYLAAIGRRGGQAGRGASKVRGGVNYYKRISRLAAKARAAKRKGLK